MLKQASYPLLSEPAVRDDPVGEERVIYFSFFIPHSLKQLFINPKGDRRILKMETDCRCLFRLSPMQQSPRSASRRFQLVEAFLDQQLGNFDSCASMLKALLSSAGSEFQLYRTINLNTLPNGSQDYRCYCATPDQLQVSAAETPLTLAPSVDQSVSTASSSVSQLLFSGSESIARKSRESLASFVCLESTVGQLEEIAASSYCSVVEAVFFQILTDELSSEIWRCCLRHTATDLVQSTVRQLIENSSLVSQAAFLLVDCLLDSAAIASQLCSDILNDNVTVVWSGSVFQSDCSIVSSICRSSLSQDVKTEVDEASAAESSMLSVSELLFDEGSGFVSNCSHLPPQPAPRMRISAAKRKFEVLGSLLDPLLADCCTFTVEQLCLEALVESVSQRLVQSLHNSSRSENQFECRVLKTLARFNSGLRALSTEPDLAGVVARFFSCVADSLASPDTINTGQVTGLVTALQSLPAPAIATVDWGGWQLLRTMREAFERAVCEQMVSLSGKLRPSKDAATFDNEVRMSLSEAFKAAGDGTSVEPDSLPSDTSELVFKQLKWTPATKRQNSPQNMKQLQSEEALQSILELEYGVADLRQPSDRRCRAFVRRPASAAVSIAVWLMEAPVRCEASTADGWPDKDVFSVTLLSIGHASLVSTGCSVVSKTNAVTTEFGPGLHVCSTLSFDDSTCAPAIQNVAPAMQTIAEFPPALFESVALLSRSVCLHQHGQEDYVRKSYCTCSILPASVPQQSCRPLRRKMKLLKSATSHKPICALAAACTVQSHVQPLRRQCCSLSQLAHWLPESTRRLEFSRCGFLTAGRELAPAVASCEATAAVSSVAAAEPLGTSALSMRATLTTVSQRLCGRVEPTESSWRLCATESALALASAVSAAPACRGGEFCECGWARPSACLRPALAASTAALLAQAATAARPAESFNNAGGYLGRLSEVPTIGDASNNIADGLSNADCSLAVCWSGPDWATVTRVVPSKFPAVLAPCPALRCRQVDTDEENSSCEESVATKLTVVPASAALTVVSNVGTDSLVLVPEDSLGINRRLQLRLSCLGKLSSASIAGAESRKLLRLLADRRDLLDRILTDKQVNGFL